MPWAMSPAHTSTLRSPLPSSAPSFAQTWRPKMLACTWLHRLQEALRLHSPMPAFIMERPSLLVQEQDTDGHRLPLQRLSSRLCSALWYSAQRSTRRPARTSSSVWLSALVSPSVASPSEASPEDH